MKFFVIFFLSLLCFKSYAGYYELSFSGNYRKIFLPTNEGRKSFDKTLSYTGSIAYYFAEMAALELSYTRGQSERFVPSTTADSRTTYDYGLIGLDLIFTFADRKAPFIPYLKGGLAYFAEKSVTYEFTNNTGTSPPSDTESLDPTLVPSLGFGLKFRVTKTMALKLGVEAWTSDALGSDVQLDWAGRAGVSWFF